MNNIIKNINPNHNPLTTLFGCGFICISAGMYITKYLMPIFIVFKQDVPYEWYIPIIPALIGIVLFFINDIYFNKILNRLLKFIIKK